MFRPLMGTRNNSNFRSRFSVFLLLLKDLVYILCLFNLLSNICFSFSSTRISKNKSMPFFQLFLSLQLLRIVRFLLALIQLHFMFFNQFELELFNVQ